GIAIEDGIPTTIIPDPNAISSHQDISTAVQGDDLKIRWSSSKMSGAGYILYYRFSSDTPPEEVANALMVPAVTLKTLDLSALGPTNSLFLALFSMTGNYYISLGLAIGITLAFLLLVYTIIVLAVNIASVTLAGRGIAYGVKKAFGKTRVRWQIDGVAAVLLLLLGIYVSAYLAPEPFGPLTLTNSLNILISEPMAFAGTALMLLGMLMAYFTLENLAKIIMLERIYGVSVREERGVYLTDLVALKEKLETLKKLVKQYAAENFDVSEEYSVISSISSEKMREFEKKLTAYSRAMLDDYTDRVDTAIEKLAEKKKLADENWPKWKETIAKMLAEHNEVHSASLISIPVALRQWALAKYLEESPEEGLVLEESAIKRRKLAPLVLIKEAVSAGYIKGGMILKKENLLAAWFEKDESPTVAAALAFKLKLYLSSLAKAMELGELTSFASVGDDSVFVIMKSDSYDTGIFVVKDKFKDAVEAWKKKLKMLSEEG
ncbi:hypothetical protein H0O02_01370, partial [Candidatus Micrarchaeota archaeon]|nr:hypothetical protein [Candidatus Micrarchaeota archaeon]